MTSTNDSVLRRTLSVHWLALLATVLASNALPVIADTDLSGKIDDYSAKIYNKKLQEAQKGVAKRQLDVARRLETGKGTTQDSAQAFFWYHKAAEQGIAEAQHKSATMLEHGRGTARDPARARQWYEKAAAQRYAPAIARLAVLEKTERKEIQEAQRAAQARAQQKARREARQQAEQKAVALAARRKAAYEVELRAEQAQRSSQTQLASQQERQRPTVVSRIQEPVRYETAERYNVEPVSSRDPQQLLLLLLRADWLYDNAAVDFLPSELNRCISQGQKLSCFTVEREVVSGQSGVRYMTQSTIDVDNGGLVSVNYRYQVTRVLNADDHLQDHHGPRHPLPQKGWQDPTVYRCRLAAADRLECSRDDGIQITFVNGNTSAISR